MSIYDYFKNLEPSTLVTVGASTIWRLYGVCTSLQYTPMLLPDSVIPSVLNAHTQSHSPKSVSWEAPNQPIPEYIPTEELKQRLVEDLEFKNFLRVRFRNCMVIL